MASTPTPRSPFSFAAAAAGEAQQALSTGLAAIDQSAHGKLLVQGDGADGVIEATLRVADLAVGFGVEAGAEVETAAVYRLRRELFYVSTAAGAAGDVGAGLGARVAAAGDFVTVTDVTRGRSQLLLLGAASAALLSKLCGLDLGEQAFPNGAAKQTSCAKTRQLIIRRDECGVPAFAVIGGRSLASYLWETIAAAGAEFGVTPVGMDALHAWRESASTSTGDER